MNKKQAAAVKIGDTLRTSHYPARDVEVISIHLDGTRTARTWGDGHRVFPVFGVRIPNKDGHYLEEVSYSDLTVPLTRSDEDQREFVQRTLQAAITKGKKD